jgi:proteasome activator subunit 4
MCTFAQLYCDPEDIPDILDEVLPYFSTSFVEGAFVVIGILNLIFPTTPPQPDKPGLLPQNYLPTIFHLWSLVNRSRTLDQQLIELFSRLTRDALTAKHVPFSAYGIFTREQSAQIFTAIFRMLEIPVGQSHSPYSNTVDASAGLGGLLERDPRKHPLGHHIARWIVMSLSPDCLDKPDSILSNLEGLIQAVETFFHPSNAGSWTKLLSQLVYYLADFFVMRWNRERSGEIEVPEHRKLNDAVKRRFVLCLRDVIFMGIYSKSGTAMNFSLSTLQNLAYLEPQLIIPGALQRIYPSMQGLVEVHRTTSSLRALQILSRIMVREHGFRCHVTTMLGLALPGIDANDLDKTLYTLSYLQSVCYNIPFQDLTEGDDRLGGNMLAMDWITSEVTRMEQAGSNLELSYNEELTQEQEEDILRSSTAGFSEFLSSFLGRVFTLLENLPDAARVRSGSPEENVVNTLPATFTPLLASLSPELYDFALNKIADFVGNHVIHQARDAMAFICNSLCKVNPKKALKRLIPMLISSIRTEIDVNGAASTRNTGTEVLPRDRGLVWNISMLGMCVVHVGDSVLPYKEDLLEIASYMQQKCKGTPTVHVSNFIHHLLLNLTSIYTVDFSILEEDDLKNVTPASWGKFTGPENLNIKWHVPNSEEVEFAMELFRTQGQSAMDSLQSLLDGTSPIKRDGSGKAWSDEVSRNLVLIRLILAGSAVLFDAKAQQEPQPNGDTEEEEDEEDDDSDDSDDLNANEESEIRPTFRYADGYPLKPKDSIYHEIHEFRQQIGELLHKVHHFLIKNQEDDVACFNPLYTAYKSWFIDVGIEKSAHVLDRVLRLFAADIHPYKVSGLRKEYPRPLLLRRANVYHLQRLRHNASPRVPSELEKRLLLDLAQSSVSSYTEVRRNAQNAIESASKSIIGARPLLIPPVLRAFEMGIKSSDFGTIKGAIHTLLFGSLSKTIGRDWRYAPTMIRAYLAACEVDRPSVQKLCSMGTMQIMDFGRSTDRMAVLDEQIIELIAPSEDVSSLIKSKRERVKRKRAVTEAKKAKLTEELVNLTRRAHWKTASRTAAIVVTLGFRFETLASDNLIDLLAKGTIDTHPGLRNLYTSALVALFSLLSTRIACDHKYENYILDELKVLGKIEVATKRDQPNWTEEHLASFAKPETAYYVDHEYPGWLMWTEKMPAYKSDIREKEHLDDVETRVIRALGLHLTRDWFHTLFQYLLQEPRDSGTDKFRVTSAMLLGYAFNLMHDGHTAVTFEEIKEEILLAFGDGGDKHKHRATSEILGGLIGSSYNKSIEIRSQLWEFCMGLVLKIFNDGLTPENSGYWTTFLHLLMQGKDPRRSWPLLEWLADFRLDMNSNAAFRESSKILLLQQCITDAGWHFQLEKPILKNFLDHLDHPYKGVRDAIGQTLAAIYRTRYHESYKDLKSLVMAQKAASSLGIKPYQPTTEFTATMRQVFDRLEVWRQEREPGQQTPSSYTSGSKTVLLWLDCTLSSHECIQLTPFFPDVFMAQLLHMMDVKEDTELQSLAYHVFRHLPNIPFREGEDDDFIDALIRIGTTSPLWHQRLRVLINIQVLYFRQLFLMSTQQQQSLFDCVAEMLKDPQHEVRQGAMTTLSGMIRCSRIKFRDHMVANLKKKFTNMLLDNPLPKRPRNGLLPSTPSTGASTPTPEHNRLVITRHAAVLGLGALVQAFPYTSPPPDWIPVVLTTLANKANSDPGVVGKSVKSILSDFKKTRQDTWQMDLKVCCSHFSLCKS